MIGDSGVLPAARRLRDNPPRAHRAGALRARLNVAPNGPSRLTLQFSSDLAELPRASAAVRAFAARAGLEEEDLLRTELLLSEVVTNAILHAYGGAAGQPVEVEAEAAPDGVSVCVFNRGEPLDPARLASASMPLPDPKHPATLPENGRGLALVKELAAEAACGITAGRNWFRFVIRPGTRKDRDAREL